jgi:hypothetical protein
MRNIEGGNKMRHRPQMRSERTCSVGPVQKKKEGENANGRKGERTSDFEVLVAATSGGY